MNRHDVDVVLAPVEKRREPRDIRLRELGAQEENGRPAVDRSRVGGLHCRYVGGKLRAVIGGRSNREARSLRYRIEVGFVADLPVFDAVSLRAIRVRDHIGGRLGRGGTAVDVVGNEWHLKNGLGSDRSTIRHEFVDLARIE